MKFVIGLLVSFLVGAGCRYFELPAPAPPMLQGAMLVVAMTLGFVLTDKAINNSAPAAPAAAVAPATRGSGENPPAQSDKGP